MTEYTDRTAIITLSSLGVSLPIAAIYEDLVWDTREDEDMIEE